jgi:hypothetical protein
MTTIRWERYPLLAQQEHTRSWLQIQGNLVSSTQLAKV